MSNSRQVRGSKQKEPQPGMVGVEYQNRLHMVRILVNEHTRNVEGGAGPQSLSKNLNVFWNQAACGSILIVMSKGKSPSQMSAIDKSENYHNKLEKWTSKEMQLVTLHEEVITKREALLRTSRNLLHDRPPEEMFLNDTDAALRSDRMMKDFATLEEALDDGLHAQKSPRFSTLQTNYWSMVNNMYPLWERAMADEIPTRDSNVTDARSRRDLAWSSLSRV
ncbi:hypothetical protein RRG08_023908 [Elysia crispata]|uniref:Uncharacterized protein n=1 Tax=Elysia crispata TaxID=231223 RepID=A0AAE1DXY8_9GAST|nr:hypothetical protein RRG08_023908 [Elysia crispata]